MIKGEMDVIKDERVSAMWCGSWDVGCVGYPWKTHLRLIIYFLTSKEASQG